MWLVDSGVTQKCPHGHCANCYGPISGDNKGSKAKVTLFPVCLFLWEKNLADDLHWLLKQLVLESLANKFVSPINMLWPLLYFPKILVGLLIDNINWK